LTADAAINPVPVMVTEVPPLGLPVGGLTPVTVGVLSAVNWSAVLVALVPEPVVAVMLTVPAAPAGDPVTISVGETTT
jgi:hypothetical protein